MFGLVHRYAPESVRARGGLTLLFSSVALVCLGIAFVTHGLTVPLTVGVGGAALALAFTLGLGLAKQAEAAPEAANPAWTPEREVDTDADPVQTLQQRYAEGEVDDEEFERRMDRLLESGTHRSEPVGEREASDRTVERATE